jgi:membrane-bound lytic murein transglycosylase B
VRKRRVPTGGLLAAGVVATGLVLLLTIGVRKPEQLAEAPRSQPAATETARPPGPPPGAVAPVGAVAAPQDRPRASDLAELDSWSRRLAKPAGLASNVISAYGRAEMWLRDDSPACHLSWVTLAGIGQVQAAGAGPLPVPDGVWQHWAARASSDGKPPDPRDVEDAALTAARALCSGGQDLNTIQGWWAAVLAYTQSAADTRDALAAATGYAAAKP